MEMNPAENAPAVPRHSRRWFVIVTSCVLVGGGAFGITTGIRLLRDARTINGWLAELESSDRDVRAAALNKLGERDINTSSRLIELLAHPNPEVRRFSVRVLQSQRPIPRNVIAEFQSLAGDEGRDKETRWSAIYTLGTLANHTHGPPDESERATIAALCRALRSSDADITASAASALREYGPRAPEAIAPLVQSLNQKSDYVRVQVIGALVTIDPARKEAMLPALLAMVRSDDATAVNWALTFIAEFRDLARPATTTLKQIGIQKPALLEQLNDTITAIETDSLVDEVRVRRLASPVQSSASR